MPKNEDVENVCQNADKFKDMSMLRPLFRQLMLPPAMGDTPHASDQDTPLIVAPLALTANRDMPLTVAPLALTVGSQRRRR